MNYLTCFRASMLCVMLFACSSPSPEAASATYSEEDKEFLGIPKDGQLSAASKRALERGYAQGPDWFCDCKSYDLKGDFAFEEGVTRRDPSAVLSVNGKFYVYYSRTTGITKGFHTGDPANKVFPWDLTEIWYATSEDGWTWKEEGLAVGRGAAGSYDDRSVFTPEVMQYEDKFVLTYQTVKHPYVNRVKNQVGMAIATSPEGPFRKLDAPIISPADNGEWLGDADDRFQVKRRGDFDSHKVHDPCLMHFKDKFYLYYKGERMGEQITLGGREIKHGVAISDKLEGPYIKSPFNPISNSGHEVCVWPYQGGIAAMITTDGPERNTLQWAPDGINFEIQSYIKGGPHAAGLVRSLDTEKSPTEALSWGLTHKYHDYNWQFIRRFECKPPKRAI